MAPDPQSLTRRQVLDLNTGKKNVSVFTNKAKKIDSNLKKKREVQDKLHKATEACRKRLMSLEPRSFR